MLRNATDITADDDECARELGLAPSGYKVNQKTSGTESKELSVQSVLAGLRGANQLMDSAHERLLQYSEPGLEHVTDTAALNELPVLLENVRSNQQRLQLLVDRYEHFLEGDDV